MKSVKSIHLFKSVIQAIYDIVKAYDGIPIANGIREETKEEKGGEFIIQLNNQ